MAWTLPQMSSRERKLVSMIGFGATLVLLLALPFGLDLLVRSERSDNDEIRQAIADVQEARSRIRERQAQKEAIALRYSRRAPALAGYLEEQARLEKLEVSESTPLPDVPHGKRYVEHATDVRLKKAGMLAIARFLESIEKSGYPIAVTRLNIRKRSGENDSYEVEVGVSAFDRLDVSTPTPAASSAP
jgi:general secretion pathway protein M